MTRPVVGLDLGGTKIAAALFPEEGEPTHCDAVALKGRTGEAVGVLVVERVLALLEAAELNGEPAAGVGIAVPGIYRAATETVWAPNIPGWDDYPLVEEVRAGVPDGVPVRVDSDRACAILGETWRGGAAGARNAISLVVGTGIGAGIMVEGRIVRGAGDAAGAIGWLALDRPYHEGYEAVGCFEYHASGAGIAAKARRLIEADHGYGGALRSGDLETLTARDVLAAYEDGDAIAVCVLDEAVIYWGMAVANLVSLFNPETIIFGGGVFGPAVQFLERIREEAMRWAQPISIRQVVLRASQLGDDAVLYGAGRLAMLSQP
ncbi:MAG: ROK family protein [Gemmatimonadales bacterium]